MGKECLEGETDDESLLRAKQPARRPQSGILRQLQMLRVVIGWIEVAGSPMETWFWMQECVPVTCDLDTGQL
jgi:hypothetical protein